MTTMHHAGRSDASAPGHAAKEGKALWRALLPLAVAVIIAWIPAPPGLAQHAWYFFAIFTAVIAGLVVEPVPSPAIGVIGVTLVAVLANWVLFSPAETVKPGFKIAEES